MNHDPEMIERLERKGYSPMREPEQMRDRSVCALQDDMCNKRMPEKIIVHASTHVPGYPMIMMPVCFHHHMQVELGKYPGWTTVTGQ